MPRADVFPASRWRALLALALVLCGSAAFAAEPKQALTPLDDKEFFKPDLYISSSNVPLADVQDGLANKARWLQFQGGAYAGWVDPTGVQVWIDPRSGAATNIMGAFPLIPGKGVGNGIKARGATDAAAVERAVRGFIGKHADLLGIDVAQLGEARVSLDQRRPLAGLHPAGLPGHAGPSRPPGGQHQPRQPGDHRHRHLGQRRAGSTPSSALPAEAALQAGFAFVEGPALDDVLIQPAKLEVVPFAPSELQSGDASTRARSARATATAWCTASSSSGRPKTRSWEVLVDAAQRRGPRAAGHQPLRAAPGHGRRLPGDQHRDLPNAAASAASCRPAGRCPSRTRASPRPTTSPTARGIFDWTSGTVTTTLTGRYVRIVGHLRRHQPAAPTTRHPQPGRDQRPARLHHARRRRGRQHGRPSRSAFYEVNKIEEMARGWLPTNTWLTGSSGSRPTSTSTQTCNGFWNGCTINFYRSGGGCRNTGELAGVFDHEWGHGMDDNDANGAISNSGEGYADIAAMLPLPGLLRRPRLLPAPGRRAAASPPTAPAATPTRTRRRACTAPSTARACATPTTASTPTTRPDTALGLRLRLAATPAPAPAAARCTARPRPSARRRGTSWRATCPPLGFDSQTSFVIGNRLFYQGSGNIGTWYSCTCGGTSSGCGATNGYMQWITADDDNGNLNDGTPHIDGHLRRVQPARHRLRHPDRRQQRLRGPAQRRRRSHAHRHRRQLPGSAVLERGGRRHPLLGVAHRGPRRLQLRQGAASPPSPAPASPTPRWPTAAPYSYNVVAVGPSASCFSRGQQLRARSPRRRARRRTSRISCSPSSVTVTQGGSQHAPAPCSPRPTASASAVTLSCTGPPTGVTCTLQPRPR